MAGDVVMLLLALVNASCVDNFTLIRPLLCFPFCCLFAKSSLLDSRSLANYSFSRAPSIDSLSCTPNPTHQLLAAKLSLQSIDLNIVVEIACYTMQSFT